MLSLPPLRGLLAARVRADVRKRVKPEHYPAPYAIVDLWERYGARGEQAFRAEAESIGRLLVTRTCRNLVHVFELRERLRNLAPKGQPSAARSRRRRRHDGWRHRRVVRPQGATT